MWLARHADELTSRQVGRAMRLVEMVVHRAAFKKGIAMVRATVERGRARMVLIGAIQRRCKVLHKIEDTPRIAPTGGQNPLRGIICAVVFIRAAVQRAVHQAESNMRAVVVHQRPEGRKRTWLADARGGPAPHPGVGDLFSGITKTRPNMALYEAAPGAYEHAEHFICPCLVCGAKINKNKGILLDNGVILPDTRNSELPMCILGDDNEFKYWKQYLLGDPITVGFCIKKLYHAQPCVGTPNRVVWRHKTHED